MRNLVELHGGEVSATSRGLGLGAELVVTLPLVAASVEPTAHPQRPRRPAAIALGGDRPLAGIHVLLVEEQPDSREVLAEVLMHQGAGDRGGRRRERASGAA